MAEAQLLELQNQNLFSSSIGKARDETIQDVQKECGRLHALIFEDISFASLSLSDEPMLHQRLNLEVRNMTISPFCNRKDEGFGF